MQTVLRLLPDGRPRAVEHVVRDLLARMSRQAVQDDGLRGGVLEQCRVDAEAREVGEPLLVLCLLAHARPHIGIDDLRAYDRLMRIVRERDLPAERARGT